MNTNITKPTANSAANGGILGAIGSAFSGIANTAKQATGAVTSAVTGNSKKNNTTAKNNKTNTAAVPVKPVTAGTNIGGGKKQRGGVASVNYSVPGGQRQPSEAVMQWATTAGAPTPSGSQMRNVAHGGKRRSSKRRTHRRKSTHRRRSGGKRHSRRHHTMKRKTHRRRHHKRSSHSKRRN